MMREDRKRFEYDVLRRHARGESIRGIARTKGIARKTVQRIIRAAEQRRAAGDDALAREGPKPRAPRSSKLDPHVEFIAKLLKEFPDITAKRVQEELESRGFDGSYTIVREHVSKRRPKPKRRAHDPVVTAPGQQAQVDWSPYEIDSGETINAFSSVLHYSRYQYADFSENRQQITLFRHLNATFEDYGGVPHELVFDSEKTVVDRWEGNTPIINLGMLDFAAYYGFELHIAPRGDGAYKGGVERAFWFMEQNLFNGRKFSSLQEARKTLAWWLEHRANARTHSRKRWRPVDKLAEERPLLKPLPAKPYDTSEICWCIVDGFHSVLFETNTYTVPRNYVGHNVCVRASETTVEVYDGYARLLARHERAPRGARAAIESPEHRRRRRVDIDKVLERFESFGERALSFARRLRQQQRYAGKDLCAILELQSRYSVDDLIAALHHAQDYQVYRARDVIRIIEARGTPLSRHEIVVERIRTEIRETLVRVPVRQRGLETYQQMLSSSVHTPEEDSDEQDQDPDGDPG